MKNLFISLLCVFSLNTLAQTNPVVTYDGGDIYFIPAKLTTKGVPFMYSCKSNYDTHKTWFTVFDENLNVVKKSEFTTEAIKYKMRTVKLERTYLTKELPNGDSIKNGNFVNDWTITSDVTEEQSQWNDDIACPEVFEDNNNYHSRYLYLSQTLFDNDEDFELLRNHYEAMPTTYCAADDPSNNYLSYHPYVIDGEYGDELINEGYDENLGMYRIKLIRYKYYGGVKNTGIDVVSLDGKVKKRIDGITDLSTVVAIRGNYYVSAYDKQTSEYGLYKLATATTSLTKVTEISGKTSDNATYNIAGFKVKANTKGIVIRNGKKIINK